MQRGVGGWFLPTGLHRLEMEKAALSSEINNNREVRVKDGGGEGGGWRCRVRPWEVERGVAEEQGGEEVLLLAAVRDLCNDANTDVVVEGGGEALPCHSTVLRARAPGLAQLLGAGEVQVGVPAGILAPLLTYIYTGDAAALEGVQLAALVQAQAGLQVRGLEEALLPLVAAAPAEEVVEVLVVSVNLGVEKVVAAALARVNKERGTLVKQREFREALVGCPAALLLLYEAAAREEEVAACYTCGALTQGPSCTWCSGA